jgi:hypothetical protein
MSPTAHTSFYLYRAIELLRQCRTHVSLH